MSKSDYSVSTVYYNNLDSGEYITKGKSFKSFLKKTAKHQWAFLLLVKRLSTKYLNGLSFAFKNHVLGSFFLPAAPLYIVNWLYINLISTYIIHIHDDKILCWCFHINYFLHITISSITYIYNS